MVELPTMWGRSLPLERHRSLIILSAIRGHNPHFSSLSRIVVPDFTFQPRKNLDLLPYREFLAEFQGEVSGTCCLWDRSSQTWLESARDRARISEPTNAW